jgi:hypothetical protein
MTITEPKKRELDRRRDGGIEVSLLWHEGDDTVSVAVEDEQTGDSFEVEVPREQALEAFKHPYVFRRAA